MRWCFAIVIFTIGALAVGIFLAGCGSETITMPPEEVVQRFLVAIEKEDYTLARSYASRGELNPESIKIAFPAGSYVSGDANIHAGGESATVVVNAPVGSIEEGNLTFREMNVFLLRGSDGSWKIESVTAK